MSAADAVRVQQARAALSSFPPDAELARMPAAELVTWCVRMQGAAQLLDAYIRDAETGDARCLAGIRAVLAGFDWERDDSQYALERIEMLVATGEDQGDEPPDICPETSDGYHCNHYQEGVYRCCACGAEPAQDQGGAS